MSLAELLLLQLILIAGVMLALWLVSLPLRNASIVDVFWGIGFVLVAWTTSAAEAAMSPRSWLVLVLATVWGLRLAAHLGWRNWGQGEDHRYAEMRERFGERFSWISLFVVFWLQGLLMWIVALPIMAAPRGSAALGAIDLLGAALWSVGFLFESVGDWQLARFRADAANRGRVMDRGLWRYTRHPNYFGDFLVWWGLYTIAAAGGQWWTIVSPIVMSILLLRISGVTLLERSLKQRRPGYAEYAARTSSFFPWPPRGKAAR